jgi:FkbM family methyltransferase
MSGFPGSTLWPVDSIENHTFFPHALRAGDVVIDLGANRGEFSRGIVARYGVRCFGVEPNPNLFGKLVGDEKTRFVQFAVTPVDGPVTLHLSEDVTSSSVVREDVPLKQGDVQVSGKTLATFLKDQEIGGDVSLIKVDIEGAEVGMFGSMSDDLVRRFAQFTIEFHDDHRLMTTEQFEQIRDRLFGLGFNGIRFASNNTNWLFFQPKKVSVGPLRTLYVRHVIRNLRGALRKMGYRNN